MPAFTKELLKELSSEDTVYDWVYAPSNGFLRYMGKLQQYLNRKHPKGAIFSIPFYKNNTNSIIIRFPGIAVLGILGFNIGLYGAVSFSKLYATCDKTSALYFILSNLFFSGMNASGFIYHCILPNDHKWRYIFRYFDQVFTGIAGVFMGFAVKSVHKEINHKNIILYLDDIDDNNMLNNGWDKEKYNILGTIGSALVLPIIHPIFGDIIYIGSVLSSAYNVLACNLKLREYDADESDIELKHLKTMTKSVLFVMSMVGIGVLADKHVALWSNGKVNVMRTMFMFSDIGYMFVQYYGMKAL